MAGNLIHELWAWCTLDDGDGNEGILGYLGPLGMMPMVGADRPYMESLRELAEAMAKGHSNPIELRRFSAMTVVETL